MKKTSEGYKLLLYYLSIFAILIGIILLLPLVVLPFYWEEAEYAYCFVIPGVCSILGGYLLSLFMGGVRNNNLERHQDTVLVVCIWIVAIVISSIPFMLSGNYNFTQSIFEVTSGYSTTGLTVVDANECLHIFLLYRSIILFVGGIGLVLILTCAISDKYGFRLYNAEGHSDKLLPNLAKSARLIFSIYAGYILLGTIAYTICGMETFDALNHAISALSTGGFSTKSEGIMFYNSLPIEIITIVLMLLGGTNFLIHLYLFRGKIKNVVRHAEFKFVIALVAIFLPILASILFFNNYSNDILSSVRISAFQFVSCLTTTGFQTVSSLKTLPCAFITIMVILMLVGGGLGSTAGGIKQYRMVISLKAVYFNFRDKISNRKVVKTHFINKAGCLEELTKEAVSNNLSFVLVYLIVFFIGTFIFTCFGFSLQDSAFEFSSALGTVGLSVGITGFSAHPVILWTAIIGMFLGRLEIIAVFNAFIRISSDIRKKEVM